MNSNPPLLISIAGPTAVGKTALAIKLALEFKTEILSVDSRQCYKELLIGTAKPSGEELRSVPHHFIDHLSITQTYTAADFEKESIKVLDTLYAKYEVAVAVGGSGLFFKALWEGFDEIPEIDSSWREQLKTEYKSQGLAVLVMELENLDPVYFHQVDLQNPQRVIRALEVIRATGEPFSAFRNKTVKARPFRNLKIGLELPREVLYQRIDDRMDEMIRQGLFEETENLYPFRNHNALQTVGYQEIIGFINGSYNQEEAIRLLKRNSRHYAKRQLTWFKRDPQIEWFSPDDYEKIRDRVQAELRYS